MFKDLIGILLLAHAGYSLSKYRKYLTFSDPTAEFHIPLDVKFFVYFFKLFSNHNKTNCIQVNERKLFFLDSLGNNNWNIVYSSVWNNRFKEI